MAAGVGPAKEPKRRLKMKEMVGEFGGEKPGEWFLYITKRWRKIGNWFVEGREVIDRESEGRLRDSVIGAAYDVR